MKEYNLVDFDNRKVRRIWYNDSWYFSVVDIIRALTDSINPRKYWNKLSERLKKEGNQTVTNCHQLKLKAEDGKNEKATNVASMVKQKVLTKLNLFRSKEYLNVSVNSNSVENVLIASMVKHQSNKLDPNRILGSNPGQGVSTFSFSYDLNKSNAQFNLDVAVDVPLLSVPPIAECWGKGRFAMLRENKIREYKIFNGKKIRRVWHNGVLNGYDSSKDDLEGPSGEPEWFFSVVDIVEVLTESIDSKDYWYRLKRRELEHGIELSTICRQLKLKAEDGKMRETDCANVLCSRRGSSAYTKEVREPFQGPKTLNVGAHCSVYPQL